MSPPETRPQSEASPRGEALASAAGIAATAAAVVFAVLLAVRPISSFDIGYHLAYGEHFLETGRIVQTNRFIYTKLSRDMLSDPDQLGPGCRYDAEGETYHFINANWLSQVAMAAVRGAGGMNALIALQAAMVAAIFALMILTMRRFRAGWHWIAPAVLIAAVAANSRFNLRPELFGYLVLVGQWYLLVNGRPGWRGAAGVIALQILAVNLHSYFLLGIALTGAMFAAGLARWVWARTVTRKDASALVRQLKWLGVATAGVIVASLCNPWHVRGALMPVQTLFFMNRHNIAGITGRGATHPWGTIGEFASPFMKAFARSRATTAYILLLVAAAAAGVVALLRRRWGWLAVLAGMSAVSLRMRRNIAPAAIILAPLCVIVLTDGWRRLRKTSSGRRRRPAQRVLQRFVLPGALATACMALAVCWAVGVCTQRYHFSERRSERFGVGLSGFSIPVDAAEWINAHRPAGTIFCDYDTSSNLMYLTRPRRKVPILTNTWAYPPYVMNWVSRLTDARDPSEFDSAVKQYGIGVVVLRHNITTGRLIRHLAKSPGWAPVNVSMNYVVFLPREGPNRALAGAHEITRSSFQLEAFADQAGSQDPVRPFALFHGAWMLDLLGLEDEAIRLWRRCLELEEDYHEAMSLLGGRLFLRGVGKLARMRQYAAGNRPTDAERMRRQGLDDLQRAEEHLRRGLELNPDSAFLRKTLPRVRRQIAALRRVQRLAPGG